MKNFELEDIRHDVEEFCQKKEKEEYLFFSGRKKTLNITSVYEYYETLHSRRVVKTIGTLFSSAVQPDKRLLQYLLEFLTLSYRDFKIRELINRTETDLANAEVMLPSGESTSYFGAQIRMINEPARNLRDIIQKECEKVISGLNPLYKLVHEKSLNIAKELGYEDYIAMIKHISGINLKDLCKLAKDFLLETEGIYISMLKKILRNEIGIDISEAKWHDLAYINRGKTYDAFFPTDKIIEIVQKSIMDMGLDITAGGHIKLLDTKWRKRKSTRAFCAPVKIPEEIYVVTAPLGGLKDYGALLHELGHALHYGYMDKTLPFEYKRLGDASLSEGFASFFDHFIYNPEWLAKYLGFKKNKDYLLAVSFKQLYLLRWYMGELLYEFELRKNPDTTGKNKIYKNIMYDACKVEFPEFMFLAAIDMDFFITRYIRAELFSSLLWDYLENTIGKRWFESKSTGEILKDIWKDGQKYTVDEIATRLGYRKLGYKSLVNRIT